MRHTSTSLHGELKELGDHWGLQTVLAVVGLVDQTLVRIRHSVYARVLLEATVIQICNLPDLQNIADLAAAAKNTGGAGGGTQSKKKTNSRPTSVALAASELPVSKPESPKPATKPPTLDAAAPNNHSDSPATPSSPAESEPETVSKKNVLKTDEPASVAAPTHELTASTVSVVWIAASANVDVGTSNLAKSVDSVELKDGSTILLTFPGEAKMTHNRFANGVHKQSMIAAVRQLTGKTCSIETRMAVSRKTEALPEQKRQMSSKDKIQRMREIEANPLVKACEELFEAEIVKVDHPQ